jgi:periplasmic protein CpxP/Spy
MIMPKKSLLSSFVLGVLLAFTPICFAQDKAKPDKEQPEKREKPNTARRGNPDQRLKRIAEELGVNDEQKEKLKNLLTEENKQLRELRENTSVAREERRAKVQQIRSETDKKVKALVTTEQFEKWKKHREEPNRRRTQQ